MRLILEIIGIISIVIICLVIFVKLANWVAGGIIKGIWK